MENELLVLGTEEVDESKNINYDELEELLEQQFTICLLYTSPSPRDTERSRMPSSA